MLVKTTDGTPDAVKVARPVWSGGKSGDNFKGLPITIGGNAALLRLDRNISTFSYSLDKCRRYLL